MEENLPVSPRIGTWFEFCWWNITDETREYNPDEVIDIPSQAQISTGNHTLFTNRTLNVSWAYYFQGWQNFFTNPNPKGSFCNWFFWIYGLIKTQSAQVFLFCQRIRISFFVVFFENTWITMANNWWRNRKACIIFIEISMQPRWNRIDFVANNRNH